MDLGSEEAHQKMVDGCGCCMKGFWWIYDMKNHIREGFMLVHTAKKDFRGSRT